ncbi:hypothetical protein B296_00054419 [Ensete ventricosum]|uniref:Uncharacterized protein n=1 Tax=Ensete ventricosum TaxID=4639 RepID=A0A426Y3Y6_ENSVE|nr:hypothetical protein B296_00054419 [Ensete ventricosum]
MDCSSGTDGSSKGCLSVVDECAVLSLDNGRNCTLSDSERKLRGFSDSSIDDRGRLDPLRLRRRQQYKALVLEAEAVLGLAWGHAGMNEVKGMSTAYLALKVNSLLVARALGPVMAMERRLRERQENIEGLRRHPKYGARVENQTYKNMYHALQQILHAEGWPGLYKGIFPSLIKSAPAGAVTFVAYEYISDWLESLLT